MKQCSAKMVTLKRQSKILSVNLKSRIYEGFSLTNKTDLVRLSDIVREFGPSFNLRKNKTYRLR